MTNSCKFSAVKSEKYEEKPCRLKTFIIDTFCLVEENFKQLINESHVLRKRGSQPKLSDSEVMTMEIVGEFLGIDTDKGYGFTLNSIGLIGFLSWGQEAILLSKPLIYGVLSKIQEKISE